MHLDHVGLGRYDIIECSKNSLPDQQSVQICRNSYLYKCLQLSTLIAQPFCARNKSNITSAKSELGCGGGINAHWGSNL